MQHGPPWPPIDPNDPKNHLADGPRYKAIGNSMAVPVMAWIGKRIQRIENGHE